MRFETRYDRWLVAALAVAAVITCVVFPVLRVSESVWLALLPFPIWAFGLLSTLPQYYVLQADGLFLRQGWRKTLLPYASLVELQCMSDSRSAAVFSTRRVVVATAEGRLFLIAVAEEQRFLDEVRKRCPQLEQRPFGLGLPLAPPSIV